MSDFKKNMFDTTRENDLKVLRIISEHTIDNPIKADVIVGLTGLEIRSVKQCVENLRFRGYKIGAQKIKPYGYFLARTPEEMRETVERKKKECLMQLEQVKRMFVWNSAEPTLFEANALADVDEKIKELEEL